ncbi:hypothetical protein AAFF_G00016620 [Aldrovandia affinis]|uniref:Uncharacterized protein n=1 Tax=Aldrovandia affinis TaxID=143900 RepID=A0AAD7WGU4_9TELE|nr:hypothetical protein AAFF_G00016620 [Aldrovandia affinis]
MNTVSGLSFWMARWASRNGWRREGPGLKRDTQEQSGSGHLDGGGGPSPRIVPSLSGDDPAWPVMREEAPRSG